MDCLNLQPFLQPVPICYSLDCLDAVIDKLHQSDRILLIDDNQTPLGVIFAHHLLGYLRDAKVWQHPLLSLKDAITPIQSLSIQRLGDRLCSQVSLDKMFRLKLFESLADGRRREVVVVDGVGTILGLLDCDRLEAEVNPSPSDSSSAPNFPNSDFPPEQTQELTAKNADLMQIDRQKTELLSWVGHELKTPLTALLGLSNLLQNPNLGSLNPRQAKYARLIQQSSRQMMTVVNDLCDLAQLENGELSLDLQPLSVQACCDSAYEQITKLRDGSPLPQLTLEIASDADTVLADRTRFCQILVHLLLNAVTTTPNTGTVGLRVERWQHWLAFLVWDTGVGIEPAAQPWIFQGYPMASSSFATKTQPLSSQAQTTSTQDPSSTMSQPSLPTGLGLVLAQRLARLHGGEISFTSQEPGDPESGGSQFTLLVPSPQYDERASSPETPTTFKAWDKDSQVRFALLVDRDSERVETLRHYLSEAGYRVFLARSGPEALAKARQLQPCVIFLNPRLPILSGWDVLTLLKADSVTEALPIVLLEEVDANLNPGAIAQHSLDTVVDWLSLPVDRSNMQRILTRLLAHQDQAKHLNRPLTLLWLVSPHRGEVNQALLLERLFHHYHYQVIEVDDFDQAGLLVKVWKPDVVLFDVTGTDVTGTEEECQGFLANFQEHPGLTQLPIVTLDEQTTAFANRATTADGQPLRVFPCLTTPERISETSGLPAVVEVIRIAANSDP